MAVRVIHHHVSLSSIPMVGCRNMMEIIKAQSSESIKHSDGGVSEHPATTDGHRRRVYQAFRWWGVGTGISITGGRGGSLSSIPMVGCRNIHFNMTTSQPESIKHSDGGVSELRRYGVVAERGVYQAFRWWGVGTLRSRYRKFDPSLSSIPMVGCRNCGMRLTRTFSESIKHSDGGVSELLCRPMRS